MADYDYTADTSKQSALRLALAQAIAEQRAVANYQANLTAGQARRDACHARIHDVLVNLLGAAAVPALPWANGVHMVGATGKAALESGWAGHVRVDVAPAK